MTVQTIVASRVELTVICGPADEFLVMVRPSPDTMLTRFVTREWLEKMAAALNDICEADRPVARVDVSSATFHGDCTLSLGDVRRWRECVRRVLDGECESAETDHDEEVGL